MNKIACLMMFLAVGGTSFGQALALAKNRPIEVIGKTNQLIAEDSPIAEERIEASTKISSAGVKNIFVHYTLTNRTDHLLEVGSRAFTFDLKKQNGERVPETETGCKFHFFSSCYNNGADRFSNLPALGPKQLDARRTYDATENLGVYYTAVSSGTYEVTGYVCGLEVGKCFKSNTVTVVVK